jgi:hypothetical protein
MRGRVERYGIDLETSWEIDRYVGGIVEGEGTGFKAGITSRSEKAIVDIQCRRVWWEPNGNDRIDIGFIVKYAISNSIHPSDALAMGPTIREPQSQPES